jgi:methionyl-tRNA formyltransferase
VRILFFGNNALAAQAVAAVRAGGDEVVGLVLHPPARRRHGDEIAAAAGVDPSCVIDGSRLRERATTDAIRALRPDMGVSVLFGYLVPPELLAALPGGCINLHPSFLPYNRGAYPNVWSIVDRTPAGVTLHYMDRGIDTGDVVARREVPVEPIDTGASLYGKLEAAALALFEESWPLVREGRAARVPQSAELGTAHRVRDVQRIDEIHLDRSYTARDLIDVLRARTFPPHGGAYFYHNGRKVFVRVQLTYDVPDDGTGAGE